MILVTGATGKTGRAVVAAAVARGLSVRALLHQAESGADLHSLGARETVVANLEEPASMRMACAGIERIYHICPNVHPREVEIGNTLIAAAQESSVAHIVYHSVLHPQLEAMPHHWRKMRVEEALLQSGIGCTILQPTAYMQNLRANLRINENAAEKSARFVVPYSLEARISLVDLEDVAAVAAQMLADEQESGGIYPLVGSPAFSQREIADLMERILGIQIVAEQISIESWRTQNARLDAQRTEALARMFAHYDRHGLRGSCRTLRSLLGREPISLEAHLRNLSPHLLDSQ
jgi:uncharacterized protein YbjT (DUF2867 family)